MRINNIIIKNYRQYQNLNFEFKQGRNNDIHIIVAQNGVGKTNLLNAVTWCLYGIEPHLGDEEKDQGLPKINLSTVKEARQVEKRMENVRVSIKTQDGDKYINYTRTLPVRIDAYNVFEETARETFTVTVSTPEGNPKIYENKDETDRYVNKYMPEKIRKHICFDGEQLNSYFMSNKEDKVQKAIFSISQVDTVSLVHQRIHNVIKDKQKEASKKAPDIKRLNDILNDTENNILSIRGKIEDLESQIAISQNKIKENTEFLQGEENMPELEKEHQKYTQEKIVLYKEKTKIMRSLFTFVREMKIALALYPSAEKILEIIKKKELANAFPPSIDKDLLIQSLKENICRVCNQPLSEEHAKHINKLIDRFQVSSQASHRLMSIRNELERIIADAKKYLENKEALTDKYKRNIEQINQTEKKLGELDNRIERISDKEELKRRYQERNDHNEILNRNMQTLGVRKEQLNREEKERDKYKDDLEKAIAKEEECKQINRIIRFANKASEIMKTVEEEMMTEVRMEMEKQTTHYFMKLIWKTETYEKIILDENFRLDLIHKDGYSCVGTCSAAERCLLALSFTLALHEVSGFNSFLFIDTPVARVSDINRTNFANVLSEISINKQIIMTFTPDEYSPAIRNIFDPVAVTNIELALKGEHYVYIK